MTAYTQARDLLDAYQNAPDTASKLNIAEQALTSNITNANSTMQLAEALEEATALRKLSSQINATLQQDIKDAIETFVDFLEEQESDILESDALAELAEQFGVDLEKKFKGTITVVFKFTGSAPRSWDLDDIRNKIGFTDHNQDCVTIEGDGEIFESYFNHMVDQEVEVEFE